MRRPGLCPPGLGKEQGGLPSLLCPWPGQQHCSDLGAAAAGAGQCGGAPAWCPVNLVGPSLGPARKSPPLQEQRSRGPSMAQKSPRGQTQHAHNHKPLPPPPVPPLILEPTMQSNTGPPHDIPDRQTYVKHTAYNNSSRPQPRHPHHCLLLPLFLPSPFLRSPFQCAIFH